MRWNFSAIFRECRGDDSLSFLKFIGSHDLRKNIRELFSKKFEGALNLRGDPEPTKLQGESLEGVELYKTVKRSRLYLPRNSRYNGPKFDILGPLAAKP